jgi:DUF1680 family protein
METGSFRRMQQTAPGQVRWTEGFFASRFKMLAENTLASMREALNTPGNAAQWNNLYIAAGLREGRFRGVNWSDGDCFKWMEAVAHVYGVTKDPALDRILDEHIEVVAKAQEPDGYIGTHVQLTDKARWGDRSYHELYNMGHLMTAAAVHHRVTGKESFLRVAIRAADYIYDLFMPRPRELHHFPWNPSNVMGLIDLYREIGDRRYVHLADTFVSMRGAHPEDFRRPGRLIRTDDGDHNQDRVPLRQEDKAVGHVVTATYLYAGAADVYAETGDSTLLTALERIWDDFVSHKMYITGAGAALHTGATERGDFTHEAYGHPYELPNASAYNETCANIGGAMWAWRMLGITGEAKYAELMERVIYNSMLSATSLDITRFTYTNPLRWHGADQLLMSNDRSERWFTHTCY